MRLRGRLGITDRRQRQATRGMQFALGGFFFVGVYDVNLGVAVNAALGLGVTALPGLLERDYDLPMDPALALWVTAAVFLHALGTVGMPGQGPSFYQSVWWYDHATHALSASVVAAVGYAVVRTLDVHSEAIYLPPRFTFAFILLFVLAFGVLWEVLEFGVAGLAGYLGTGSVLTQYGLGDTMLDLLFDTAGGVLTAVWGTAYLTDVVAALQCRLEDAGRA